MKILYLSEDYPYSKVHHELCLNIIKENPNLDIILYSVIRSGITERDLRPTYRNINYETLFYKLDVSEKRYKYDFIYKTRVKYNWLVNHNELFDVSLTYAATLFSEGAIALKIYKEKNIPYIVAVRGTDVNFYFKYMFHLWPLGIEIMNCAKRIVFVTENISRNVLSQKSLFLIRNTIAKKKIIIPNGIDQEWLENTFPKKVNILPRRLLYIGIFDKNKNILTLIDVVIKLQKKYKDLKLTLIGGGGELHEKVINLCSQYPSILHYVGKVYDNEKLRNYFRSNDIFVMVSHSETFGLVYIEALSQGLPVLFTKNQGVDKTFIENIGESVNSQSKKSISIGLQKIIEEYPNYDSIDKSLSRFSWKYIAQTVIKLM